MTISRLCMPRQGFMPPFILERIIERGGARLQASARQTLNADHGFRARRTPAPGVDETIPPGSPTPGEPARYIYSAEQQQELPGTLVREEGQAATDDPAVDEAYRWLGATYRFYWEVFERHSIDR